MTADSISKTVNAMSLECKVVYKGVIKHPH